MSTGPVMGCRWASPTSDTPYSPKTNSRLPPGDRARQNTKEREGTTAVDLTTAAASPPSATVGDSGGGDTGHRLNRCVFWVSG
ncbi:hypothetical protein Hdeb2414_s0001g00012711 [Helianthus debilis subsp. tardiflorus]